MAYQPKKDGVGIEIKKVYYDKSQDKDFSSHKEGKSTATYPVDLSRTLTADRFIPAVLINEIKSELPSKKVVAQKVTQVFVEVTQKGSLALFPKVEKEAVQSTPDAEETPENTDE